MQVNAKTEKPALVRPGTAARMLDCGVSSVYEAMKRDKVRWVRFLDGATYPVEEIERLKREGL